MAVTNATITRRTCYFTVKENDCEIFNFLVTVFLERFEVGTLRSNLPSINTNRSRNEVTRRQDRGTQQQFSENICSEDDLRSRIFGTFVVKFLASLPLLGFSNV